MCNNTSEENTVAINTVQWAEFLQNYPPGSEMQVGGAFKYHSMRGKQYKYSLEHPILKLYCPESSCQAIMNFKMLNSNLGLMETGYNYNGFLVYRCNNCEVHNKTFAVIINIQNREEFVSYKLGEYPQYGPPIPSRAIELIQPDRDLLLQGRRCESQGLGIGAYSYYRRIVEKNWERLIDKIIEVANKLNANSTTIESLRSVREEKQFKGAVQDIKDAIPQDLLVFGKNPLTLLHGALSKGIHNSTDEECLELAIDIRNVLFELAYKINVALKDNRELIASVKRLDQLPNK